MTNSHIRIGPVRELLNKTAPGCESNYRFKVKDAIAVTIAAVAVGAMLHEAPQSPVPDSQNPVTEFDTTYDPASEPITVEQP